MELKSLILGLAFTLGVFAVKSGAGLAHALIGRQSRRRGILLLLGFAGLYAPLFALGRQLAVHGDLLTRMETAMLLAKQGMTVHALFAALLLIWGVALLRRPEPRNGGSHGWLLLAAPCPVCCTVILGSVAFLHAGFPEQRWLPLWLFLGFFAVAAGSGLLLVSSRRQGNHSLGLMMVLAALYFLVTLAVVPQVKDLERIYRLAAAMPLAPAGSPPVLAGLILGCAAGFLAASRNLHKKSPWI